MTIKWFIKIFKININILSLTYVVDKSNQKLIEVYQILQNTIKHELFI